MTLRHYAILATALAAIAAMDPASAQAPAGSCRAGPAEAHSPDCRDAVILASYVPPRERGELVRGDEERVPEPGNWARLLAVLLGAISIARRRMS